MRNRHFITSYIMGFVAIALIIAGIAYFIPHAGLNPNGSGGGLSLNLLFIGIVVFILPIGFLKAISHFSRKVEGDDSHFNVSDIPDHHDRPTRVE